MNEETWFLEVCQEFYGRILLTTGEFVGKTKTKTILLIRNRHLKFHGNIMGNDVMENMILTGDIEGKKPREKQR